MHTQVHSIRTYTCTHAHMHARTHARTHARMLLDINAGFIVFSDNASTKSPDEPAVEDRWIWRNLFPVIKFNVADVS